SCTAVSTVLAPVLTPAIFYLLASQWLEINASAMLISVLKIVLFPILLGLITRMILGAKAENYSEVMPLVSVVSIVLIVAAVVAVSKTNIIQSGLLIFAVVILHNGLGFLLGYTAARV